MRSQLQPAAGSIATTTDTHVPVYTLQGDKAWHTFVDWTTQQACAHTRRAGPSLSLRIRPAAA
jgi:hypothetical protein